MIFINIIFKIPEAVVVVAVVVVVVVGVTVVSV